MKSLKKSFKDIKKFPGWAFWFPATLLKVMYRYLFRHEVDDPSGILQSEYAKVGVIWHNRLLYFPAALPKKLRKKTTAVVSASRDGQHTSDLLKYFNIGNVRGSSSRGGVHAQREAIKVIQSGRNVAFTPDGPRGPIYVMKKGAIQLASLTGAPIVIVTHNASKYWELKSWDKFRIPKPGAKLTLTLRGPFFIPQNLDDEGLEKYRQEIESKLNEISVD